MVVRRLALRDADRGGFPLRKARQGWQPRPRGDPQVHRTGSPLQVDCPSPPTTANCHARGRCPQCCAATHVGSTQQLRSLFSIAHCFLSNHMCPAVCVVSAAPSRAQSSSPGGLGKTGSSSTSSRSSSTPTPRAASEARTTRAG